MAGDKAIPKVDQTNQDVTPGKRVDMDRDDYNTVPLDRGNGK